MEALAILTALAFLVDALLVIPFYTFLYITMPKYASAHSATLIMIGVARGTLALLCMFLVLADSLSDHDRFLLMLLGVGIAAGVEIVFFALLYFKLRKSFKLL